MGPMSARTCALIPIAYDTTTTATVVAVAITAPIPLPHVNILQIGIRHQAKLTPTTIQDEASTEATARVKSAASTAGLTALVG